MMNQRQMPTPPREGYREFSARGALDPLIPVLFLPGACGLVATAYLLGAEWLANRALGLPTGVWVIALMVAWSKLTVERAAAARERSRGRAARRRIMDARAAGNWPARRDVERTIELAADVTSGIADLAEHAGAGQVGSTLSRVHDSIAWPTRPLRIGLMLPADEARRIVEADGAGAVEFVTLGGGADSGDFDGVGACQEHVLDSLVFASAGETQDVTIASAVGPDGEGAWYDWGRERPLSYASVFPSRIDCEIATLGADAVSSAGSAALVRALAESAAVLSRIPERLTLNDRLRGRRPYTAPLAMTSGMGRFGDAVQAAEEGLIRVSELMSGSGSAGVRAVAARVVSAFYASAPGADDERRRRVIERCAEAAPQEAEVLLRLGAARLAVLDDRAGIEALLRAEKLLRGKGMVAPSDHVLFLHSELAHGARTPYTVGRVAAGVTLLCATAAVERIPFLRDDLMDEIRREGWLMGAEGEVALLGDVFRVMERARRDAALTLAA